MFRNKLLDAINELSLFETVFADFSPFRQNIFQFFHFYFLEIDSRVVVWFWIFQFANLTVFFPQFSANFVDWLVEAEWIDDILEIFRLYYKLYKHTFVRITPLSRGIPGVLKITIYIFMLFIYPFIDI